MKLFRTDNNNRNGIEKKDGSTFPTPYEAILNKLKLYKYEIGL